MSGGKADIPQVAFILPHPCFAELYRWRIDAEAA
jgi:hypothetical protein